VTNTNIQKLEKKFASKIQANLELNRSLVSFQANKKLPFYRWFKYKEGFSAPMMDYFFKNSGINGDSKLLDPFSGSGVALFAGLSSGLSSIGIEILPIGNYIIKNRTKINKIKLDDIEKVLNDCTTIDFTKYCTSKDKYRHLAITDGAFPEENEKQLLGFLNYCKEEFSNKNSLSILKFTAFCVLESISYTRKDGQYLRWDYRANKNGNGHAKFYKGKIPSFKDAIIKKLSEINEDILFWGSQDSSIDYSKLTLFEGSVLDLLPALKTKSINIVITSPPYCNRYDYTRTYALELAFLGVNDKRLKYLRQELLTCTVENKEKSDRLKSVYIENKRTKDYNFIINAFNTHSGLQEVLSSLDNLRKEDKLNNPNIYRMVKNYFYEMFFVIFELHRVLKDNGHVYMVNDNVRYGGEVIPVDLILSSFAEMAGFTIKNIWKLNIGKGNSSQQMGKHGRTELRKCVYVWQK
jgi:DNA modification methylase